MHQLLTPLAALAITAVFVAPWLHIAVAALQTIAATLAN